MSKSKSSPIPNQSFPKDDFNQDVPYDNCIQESYGESKQIAPNDYNQSSTQQASQKLRINAKYTKAGYEASIGQNSEIKKKSKIGLEEAAKELAKHIKLSWSDFKDVTSIREQDAGRKVYEYIGEEF